MDWVLLLIEEMPITLHSSAHFLSLIVPAYCQEETIVKNIRQLRNVLSEIRYNYEIIVVVDGMVDDTFEKLRQAKIPKTTILSYEKNRGKAYAVRFGMKQAKGDYIMFIDSGMEIDPNGISMLMEHMEWYDADIIVGSKRHPASLVGYTIPRKILSYGYYYFVKSLFGISVKDTQAGIKIFKRSVLEGILPRLVEKRFAGDLEMLVVANSMGFRRIYEAPIKLNYELSKLSSAATWNSIYFIFADTLAIFYRLHFLHYYSQAHQRFVEPREVYKFATK